MPPCNVFEKELGSAERGRVSIDRLVRGTGNSYQGLLTEHQVFVIKIDHQQIARGQQRDQTKRDAS